MDGEPTRIVVDIGAAIQMLEASPELAQAMNELVGGPALVEAQTAVARLARENADMLAVLKETRGEIAALVSDIVAARSANVAGTAHPSFDEESQKELARMEAILGRADAAIAKAEAST